MCPPAFTASSTRSIPGRIAVARADTYWLKNNIVVEKNVIMNHGCPRISSQLQVLEFSAFEIPLSEIIKAGGSASASSFTSLMDSNPQATSLIASSCGQSVDIDLHSFNFYRRDSIGNSAGELAAKFENIEGSRRRRH
jgi:hypothetical protein